MPANCRRDLIRRLKVNYINLLIFVMEMRCVLCTVRTKYLNIVHKNFASNMLTGIRVSRTAIAYITYLALSGTIHGVTTTSSRGTEVAMHSIFQSAMKYAIHGRRHVAIVKQMAIDMFATNVRHCGPTYSRTVQIQYLVKFVMFGRVCFNRMNKNLK